MYRTKGSRFCLYMATEYLLNECQEEDRWRSRPALDSAFRQALLERVAFFT
jgi:hypothetical protein